MSETRTTPISRFNANLEGVARRAWVLQTIANNRPDVGRSLKLRLVHVLRVFTELGSRTYAVKRCCGLTTSQKDRPCVVGDKSHDATAFRGCLETTPDPLGRV